MKAERKQCAMCKEWIHAEAAICPHCQQSPSAAVNGIQGILGIAGIILIVAGILYMTGMLK